MASLAPPHSSHPTTSSMSHAHPHAPHPRRHEVVHPPTPPHSSPSSPSSTHSSSSAIFERDIEPISLSLAPAPRDHSLSSFVPSVLDEAVEALTAAPTEGGMEYEVEVAGQQEGDTRSQSGGGLSRSPSPPGIPAASTLASRPPLPERQSTTPFIPGGFSPPQYVPATPASLPPSPPRAHMEISPGITPTTTSPVPASVLPLPRVPSGTHATPSKRLSFVSYSDLLLSSPVTSLPLSQMTSPPHPPPHLNCLAPQQTLTPLARSREASAYGDEGGEWEREGLGRGLEERLEEVLQRSKV